MDANLPLFPDLAHTRAGITPRDYQIEDHDNSFRLWDSGVVGVLTRSFTGSGKTLQSCLKADTWMQRSDRHYVLILSYEEQLVNQYVQEVQDYLSITPGVEMAGQRVEAGNLPRITVASRASLLYHKPPTEDQIADLRKYGINDPGAAPREKIATLLRYLKNDVSVEEVRDELARINAQPEAANGKWSRVHKFDWRLNWLLILDEAHKHAHHLKSVGPIIDWFDQNPLSRRLGQTATPKRSDGVSLGDKMFPGISLDYPLYKPDAPCGVLDGWAVPYVQRYIKVNGVDFKNLKKVAGDFDEGQLGEVLGKEETLASLVEPLLDMVEDRRTLIFSPTVQMAKDVASYINARTRAVCTCGKVRWYPTLLIGDGAQCPDCERFIDPTDIESTGPQAQEIDGETVDRTTIYKGHQRGEFQFLSICGLCVAKGTMILTDCGEVPIENVTRDMKLWDGIEFVEHGGVIYKGEQAVVKYAGLPATGDHHVWTDDGWEDLAACKQHGLAIRVAGIGGAAVRESAGHYRNDHSSWQVSTGWIGSAMHMLRPSLHQSLQRAKGRSVWLQAVLKIVWCAKLVAHALSICEEAVRESARRVLSRLRRPWNRVPLSESDRYGTVDHGTPGASQGVDAGQGGERQALRAGQPSLGQPDRAGEQPASETDGGIHTAEVYDILNAGPRNRFTANGLIVSNCREGYNDRNISCVAIFRPVSKKASALAEQMKGRGCRVLPGVVDGGLTREQRLAAIASSAKTSCLIVDLVGVTGLGDCASTVQIYAEGLPDEIQSRAEEILAEMGLDDEIGVEDAIQRAKQEDADAKRRAKEERERAEQRAREEAQKRAKADARVDYSTHEVGSQRNVKDDEASEKMYHWIASLGMTIENARLTKRQAWRIADQLLSGMECSQVAYSNGLEENWKPCPPSAKQQYVMRGLNTSWVKCGTDASYVISAMKSPIEFTEKVIKDMERAKSHAHLNAVGRRLSHTAETVHIDRALYERLVNFGRSCRTKLGAREF